MKVLDRGRLHLAATCCGLADRLIGEAVGHALDRRQFARPIAEFQLVQGDAGRQPHRARRLLGLRAGRGEAGDGGREDHPACGRGQVPCQRDGLARGGQGRAGSRRFRLHQRHRRGASLSRRAALQALRGDIRDPEARDRARPCCGRPGNAGHERRGDRPGARRGDRAACRRGSVGDASRGRAFRFLPYVRQGGRQSPDLGRHAGRADGEVRPARGRLPQGRAGARRGGGRGRRPFRVALGRRSHRRHDGVHPGHSGLRHPGGPAERRDRPRRGGSDPAARPARDLLGLARRRRMARRQAHPGVRDGRPRSRDGRFRDPLPVPAE